MTVDSFIFFFISVEIFADEKQEEKNLSKIQCLGMIWVEFIVGKAKIISKCHTFRLICAALRSEFDGFPQIFA